MLLLILSALAVLSAESLANLLPVRFLNDGNAIPLLGFGTMFPKREFDKAMDAIITAIEVGYRRIDTAPLYQTETFVGNAIENVTARGIVTREHLFISSKFNKPQTPEAIVSEIQASLNRMQLDYVDLYSIQSPANVLTNEDFDILVTWKEMEKVKRMGLARSIGLTNFNSSHINLILAHSTERPAVNEIEVNPSRANMDQVAYCQQEAIAVSVMGPKGFAVPRPFKNLKLEPQINNTLLVNLAKKYRKTPHQILIRYLIDRNTTPILKSSNKMHIRENFDVFDFNLSREEIYLINEFDQNIGVYSFDRETAEAFIMDYYGITVEQLYDSWGIDY